MQEFFLQQSFVLTYCFMSLSTCNGSETNLGKWWKLHSVFLLSLRYQFPGCKPQCFFWWPKMNCALNTFTVHTHLKGNCCHQHSDCGIFILKSIKYCFFVALGSTGVEQLSNLSWIVGVVCIQVLTTENDLPLTFRSSCNGQNRQCSSCWGFHT